VPTDQGNGGRFRRDLLPWSLNLSAVEARADLDSCSDAEILDAGDWLRLISSSLHAVFPPAEPRRQKGLLPAVALAAQLELWKDCRTFREIHDPAPQPPSTDWEAALRGKLGYDGSLLLPQSLTAVQVAAGLPPPGLAGSIAAEDWCTGETREVVLNPDRVHLKREWREAPATSKVWVESEDEWQKIVALLYASLGERLDGLRGRRDLPPGYAVELADFTLWTISRHFTKQRLRQVLMGRWCRVVGLRRAIASVFDEAWRWTAYSGSLRTPTTVVEELLRALSLLPLAFHDLRAPLDSCVTASDSSTRGAAVVHSVGLTTEGVQETRAIQLRGEETSYEYLIVVSFNEELGAARRALDLLRIQPAASLYSTLTREGARVITRAWPDTVIFDKGIKDLPALEEALIGLRLKAARASHVLTLCSVGEDLNEVRDAMGVVKTVFAHLELFFLAESLGPLNKDDWGGICDLQQCLEVDWKPICGVDRIRYFSISWKAVPSARFDLSLFLDRGVQRPERWLLPGSSPPSCGVVGDFVRAIARRSPLEADLAVMQRECAETIHRWEASGWALPPCLLREELLVRDVDGHLRLPIADEREVLAGFPRGHSGPAVPSSQLKTRGEPVRLGLLSRAWQCAALAVTLGTTLPSTADRRPSGLWITILARADSEAAFKSTMTTESRSSLTDSELSAERVLARSLVRGVDHRGSDIRVDAGTMMAPASWPRQSLRPQLWKWRLAFKWKWATSGCHINILEASAALTCLKWRLRRSGGIRKKFIHILDSQVSQAVLTKRRSTSKLLNRVVRRVSALELASSSHTFYGFARSDWHPADAGSRAGPGES
jgi:hypothetical protein